MKKYYSEGLLNFYGDEREYENPVSFSNLINSCYRKDWCAYTKKTFKGPLAVIRYLGQYTHRVAISNERIVYMDEETVTIHVKDRKNGNKQKTVTMKGVEFVRRFLMHILPKGFVKIRYFGLLANRNKKTKLMLCRRLTGSPTYKLRFDGLKTVEILSIVRGKDISLCTCCSKGRMRIVRILLSAAFP